MSRTLIAAAVWGLVALALACGAPRRAPTPAPVPPVVPTSAPIEVVCPPDRATPAPADVIGRALAEMCREAGR